MKFSIYQDTDIGGRPVNQDRMGYAFTRECLLMLVADGMGGHLHGEIAAQVAMQSIAANFQREARPALADPARFLERALRRAHEEILACPSVHGLPEAPRTTVVACIVQGDSAWWAHAGDSRACWIRDGAMLARTRDHSRVESLVAMGLLQPDDAAVHPDRNKLYNCLGSPAEPKIELAQAAGLRDGDLLLLCSDGVWGALAEVELLRVLSLGPVQQAVPELVRRSVATGGRFADNATALAMRWEGGVDTERAAVEPPPEGTVTTSIAFGRTGESAERLNSGP